MKNPFIVLVAIGALGIVGACSHVGETPGEAVAGAKASVAAPSLAAEQKSAGIATLNKIVREFLDARKLYNDAADLAKDSTFKAALRNLATERGKEASDVQSHVRELGGQADTSATPGSALAGAWMSLKSVVVSDTKAAVQEVLANEDRILSNMNDDLNDPKLAGSTKDYIRAMRDNVQGDRSRIANLKS